MKNYVKYFISLVLFVVFIIPFNAFAAEVTNVYINEDNNLSFTKSGDYDVYQVIIKHGETQIDSFGYNASEGSTYDLALAIANGCDSNPEICENNYTGNYTLEIVALDPTAIDDTRTIKTITYKTQIFSGDDYNHVDVVGNETKYTITLDPDNGIQEPQVMNNLTFGEQIHLGSLDSYGITELPNRLYNGWMYSDFCVTHSMVITPSYETLFTFNLDFNGGTWNGESSRSYTSVGVGIGWEKESLMRANKWNENPEDDILVIPPTGKELDFITVNDERVEFGTPVEWDAEHPIMNVKYYWKWSEEVTVYTVTFKDGFDNVINTVEVASGEKVTRPANLVNGSLQFVGWYLDGETYDFNTPVTSNITLDVKWGFHFYVAANIKNAGVFTYNGINYNDSLGSSGDYHLGETVEINQHGINNYKIVEWRIGSTDGESVGTDSSADIYMTNDGNLRIKQKPSTSQLDFYAIYEKEKATVTFNTNGGTPIEPQLVDIGEKATKPGLYASTKNGYLLGKWYTDPALKNEFDFYQTHIQQSITLYAQWDIYLSEVWGTVNKPVAGFKADRNIISKDSSKYTFELDKWYLVDESLNNPSIEGDMTFEKDKEYDLRVRVIPKSGYAFDYNTKFYINDKETSCYGSAGDRQIRWIATDPKQVTEFNITGIVKPVEGNTFNNNNIKVTTEGLKVKEIFWKEESTGNKLTSSSKFVAGKRYILHVSFNTDYGYVLKENYNEDLISGASGFLKAEFIDNVDDYVMEMYYEATPVPLSTPVLTISRVNNNIITLKWNNSGIKYEVYQSTNNKKWTKVATTTATEYVAKNLGFNKTYYYKVRATDGKKWTGYSKTISKKIVPDKVTGLTITSVGTNNINIKYNKVATTGYEIQRSTNGKKWSKVKTVTKNATITFNNTKLKANTVYYYRVRAYKTVSGKKIYGAWSNVVNTRTAPVKPTISVSLRDYNSMNIKVSSVKGATKYYIQMSTNGTNYTTIKELTKAGIIVQNELEIGKTYYYRVRVCNSQNRCSAWAVTNKKQTTLTPGFKLSTSSKKVTVTVTGVKEADGYEVYRSTKKNGKYTLVRTLLSTNGLVFNNGTKKGTTYYYKVRSYKVVNGKKVYSSYSGIKNIKSK